MCQKCLCAGVRRLVEACCGHCGENVVWVPLCALPLKKCLACPFLLPPLAHTRLVRLQSMAVYKLDDLMGATERGRKSNLQRAFPSSFKPPEGFETNTVLACVEGRVACGKSACALWPHAASIALRMSRSSVP